MSDSEPPPEPEWKRRRRLDAAFGDVLPDSTSDDRDPGRGDRGDRDEDGDTWLLSQVPPHH